jgi:hypothetical protein
MYVAGREVVVEGLLRMDRQIELLTGRVGAAGAGAGEELA